MRLPAPRSTRELFELLRLYDGTKGLDPLLDHIDFTDVRPLQIYSTVLGRLPESLETAIPRSGYSARQQLKNALLNEEFQKDVLVKFLSAFPEKRRLLFVHIPKCAGSDLTVNLQTTCPYLSHRLTDRNWIPMDKFLGEVRKLSVDLAFSDKIFVHGHITLSWYLNNKLLRYGDHVFAVLRDPVDRIISQINYILTRFSADPEISSPDTRDWLRVLERDRLPRAGSALDVQTLAGELLRNRQISHSNVLCQYLGNNDAQSALKLCAISDIELTTMEHYEKWLLARWGFNQSIRQNASKKFVALTDFSDDDRDYLQTMTNEDRIIFDAVAARLEEKNAHSIRGSHLVA